MPTRVGIMGFGRIGRNVFRILYPRDDIDIVAIVDIADPKGLEYLLKFDTVHGRFAEPISVTGDAMYAKGRQIYSLSRAGYFPTVLSITHGRNQTPHVAMIAGSLLALAVMFALWFSLGAETGGVIIGGTLLNMAVFAAMFSYIMQALAFIRLRQKFPHIHRPYRSPLGLTGPVLTILIGTATLYYQLSDPVYRQGVLGVAVWFGAGVLYFALVGRHRLILSPEEEFALAHQAQTSGTESRSQDQ